MNSQYTKKLSQILTYSKEEAMRLGNDFIGPEHMLLGLIRDGETNVIDILKSKFHIDLAKTKALLEDKLRDQTSIVHHQDVAFNDNSSTVLRLSILEARLMKSKESDAEHLLLAIMKHKNNLAARVLGDCNVEYKDLFNSLSQQAPKPKASVGLDEENDEDMDLPPVNEEETAEKDAAKKGGNSSTPALDAFGFDLTKAAAEGKLDAVVGREKEIERLAQILARRKKNNPVLIGEPGVGKTAIIEGLATRINERKVSRILFDKRIISLDMTSIVAGTKYRGQFEERMRKIINELTANKNIIAFIDEIHTLVGAGNMAGQMDAANMLKPALSRGEMQCIGTTTLSEYRKSIEKDGALERRFQKIIVEQTSKEDTLTILHNIKDKYESHHNVTYTDDALKACVDLTARYITDRMFPDKAIDALDEVGARVHIHNINVPSDIEELEAKIADANKKKEVAVKKQNFELAASFRDTALTLTKELEERKKQWEATCTEQRQTVDADMVAEAVSLMSGIPVQRMAHAEGIQLKGMRQSLKSKIIAQDNAIDKLVSAIQRSRVGLKDPNRPIGVFMFLGPTGVGKTYLTKKLAEHMFGSTDALVRIDMSEYVEKFNVSRLVGAPPGYVGYDEGGMLTEKVRRKPYCIVLLDEIEKAHSDVYNLLLQMMDDGRLTDSQGRTVDFRNTVIIMTSNVGTRQLKEFGRGIGFSAMEGKNDKEVSRSVIQKALDKRFSPEFLNRIDEIITFDQLELDAILQIIELELQALQSRVEGIGYKLTISDEVKKFIANKGYDKQFGARPLRRAIQEHLEDKLSEIIVENELAEGTVLNATLEGENVKVSVSAE